MGKIAERNQEIFKKYEDGTTIEVLSSEYTLSEKTITYIISRTGQRFKDFEKDKLMDDIDEKERELDQMRKIQIGDLVKVRHKTIDAAGCKCTKILTGTVIHKNKKMITVRGVHYAESFSFFDLTSDLVEHIPS